MTADPTYSRRWLILAVVGVAQVMVVLDTTVVNIALPSAQRALHFSNGDRQWVVTAYALGRDRQGAGRGSRHLRRGIVRAALKLRARPHGRGRTDRSGTRLEASDQGPVAARGGFQERPIPRDGLTPRTGRGRLGRSIDRVSPADRGRTDVGQPAVRARRDVHGRGRLLHDDRGRRPPVRVPELQARVDELRVRRPDDGVAIGWQLAAPQIEIHLIESTESSTGVGEVAVPSVAPVVANAIAALTGTRIRRLPFSKTIKIY